jgi:hypothetical protein
MFSTDAVYGAHYVTTLTLLLRAGWVAGVGGWGGGGSTELKN